MMTDLPYALITGASSGIGRSYALQLARRRSHALLIVARRESRLRELRREIMAERDATGEGASPPVDVFPVDLTEQNELDRLFEHIDSSRIQLDMLINCAGIATLGAFSKADIDKEALVVKLNCLVPMLLIRALVPGMLSRGSGTIINVSSIGAFQPAPYMAVYAASKSFVLNYSLAIREELREKGIRVFVHCPGPTNTEFHLVAGLPKDMSPIPPMGADETVEEALQALDEGKPLIVNGFINRWLVRLGRLLSPVRSAKAAEKVLLSRWSPED